MDALFDVIRAKYQEQWVFAEVTKIDRWGRAVRGRVIAHDADAEKVVEAGTAFRRQHPGVRFFFFYTGELVPKDLTVVLGVG